MNRKRTFYEHEMNASTAPARTNVLPIRSTKPTIDEALPARQRFREWMRKRLVDLGIYEMAELEPSRPSGFFVNWSVVTSLIVVVSAIVGLWYFTWQTAEQSGYQRGINEAERQQLLRQIEEAKRDAADAKKLQSYQAGVADTHADTNKPQQQQKKGTK